VKDLKLRVGDKVSEGGVILTLETDGAGAGAPQPASAKPAPAPTPPSPPPATKSGGMQEVKVPDIGDFKDVPVIEVFVKTGDTVKPDDPLVTLESDKATMDVPSPSAGVVKDLKLKVGDKVSEGSIILVLETQAGAPAPAPSTAQPAPRPAATEAPSRPSPAREPPSVPPPQQAAPIADAQAFKAAHASPSVRVFARELGVDLGKVKGTGPKGRILHEDVQQFVKQALSAPTPAAAAGVTGG